MKKQRIFRPSGWDGLEVRITPSAVAFAPAAEMVRIDAHIRHAKRAHHRAHHKGPHVTHRGGFIGITYTGTPIPIGTAYGGGSLGGTSGGSSGGGPGNGTLGGLLGGGSSGGTPIGTSGGVGSLGGGSGGGGGGGGGGGWGGYGV